MGNLRHINDLQTPSLMFHFGRNCRFCNVQISDEEEDSRRVSTSCEEYQFWGDAHLYSARYDRERLHVFQCCKSCNDQEIEIQNAAEEKRRLTRIEIKRCICGAVKLYSIDCCVACSKRSRMLEKMEAEQKLIAKALVQLRKTLRERKNLTS
mgnify:CR=1 FL=1